MLQKPGTGRNGRGELELHRIVSLILVGAVVVVMSACTSRATSRYPSYERTIARYTPVDEGRPATDAPVESPDACECPRVWYRDHWVYHCDGQWLYWHHGDWYYYPHFQVYYYEGTPHVYRGTGRSIKKR